MLICIIRPAIFHKIGQGTPVLGNMPRYKIHYSGFGVQFYRRFRGTLTLLVAVGLDYIFICKTADSQHFAMRSYTAKLLPYGIVV